MSIPNALDPVAAVKAAFPDAVADVVEYAGEVTLILKPEKIAAVARYLRDTSGLVYNFLSDISAVDYWEVGGMWHRPGRFGVSYHLLSMLYHRRLRLKVYLPEDEPAVETLTTVWPAANWLEREIMDLMGVDFNGHPIVGKVTMESFYPSGTISAPFEFKEVHITRTYGPDTVVKAIVLGESKQELSLSTGAGTIRIIQ